MAMAIPPEPLQQVLPKARWVVEAEVEAVLSEGPQPALRSEPRPSAGNLVRSQSVRLKIRRVLRGPAQPSSLVVEKPEGAYLLRAGNHGPFLLDESEPPRILGRYGPDSYALKTLEAALTTR